MNNQNLSSQFYCKHLRISAALHAILYLKIHVLFTISTMYLIVFKNAVRFYFIWNMVFLTHLDHVKCITYLIKSANNKK